MGNRILQYVEEMHDSSEGDYAYRADVADPPPGIIQVFRVGGKYYMCGFICPCGCGRYCPTSLQDSKHEPRWEYSHGPTGQPNLEPSIRWLSGCKAHFNITDGEAIIHADSGT
jgi:hypothetical protein